MQLQSSVGIALLTLSLLSALANGFIPNTVNIAKYPTTGKRSTSTTSLFLSEVDPASVEDARRLFYLWFFGGSGGGGIAITAFPAMFGRFQDMRSLKGQGPTAGGESVGISPLCGFPEDLKLADVQKVLNNKMSVERMVETGPKDSFWAEVSFMIFRAVLPYVHVVGSVRYVDITYWEPKGAGQVPSTVVP
jgi:hypothetical protein